MGFWNVGGSSRTGRPADRGGFEPGVRTAALRQFPQRGGGPQDLPAGRRQRAVAAFLSPQPAAALPGMGPVASKALAGSTRPEISPPPSSNSSVHAPPASSPPAPRAPAPAPSSAKPSSAPLPRGTASPRTTSTRPPPCRAPRPGRTNSAHGFAHTTRSAGRSLRPSLFDLFSPPDACRADIRHLGGGGLRERGGRVRCRARSEPSHPPDSAHAEQWARPHTDAAPRATRRKPTARTPRRPRGYPLPGVHTMARIDLAFNLIGRHAGTRPATTQVTSPTPQSTKGDDLT